jgi:hypothetical protein
MTDIIILLEAVIKELEDLKENGIPEEIGEMYNMDEWYNGWDLAFDKAITLIKNKKRDGD